MASERTPRSLIHQIETSSIPLKVLEGIQGLREYLDNVESTALCDARDEGASIVDIAEALGTTRQTVYNRLKQLAEDKRARETEETVVIPEIEPEPQT
ncbi:MAG TPA: helix-turn-helix domain-containing protein [Actinomycetota bacterium]|nr:helix-turn-helix domain-containing protein [Actinomycetota bacterium]